MLALLCWKCDWQLVRRPVHQSEPFLTCFPRPGVRAAAVSAGKPNKAWHSTPSPGLMMSYRKYPALTAPRLHEPRDRGLCVCVPVRVVYRGEEWQGMFARHPPPPYCKVEPDHATPELGVNEGVVSPNSLLFQLPQTGPPRRGRWVQDGRGLWSMKQLQCFNKNLMVASSISDGMGTLGRLMRWYKVWSLNWPEF